MSSSWGNLAGGWGDGRNNEYGGALYILEIPNALTNINGCDSTAILNLTINQSDTSYTNITACDSLVWNGTTYTQSGTYFSNQASGYSMQFDYSNSNYVELNSYPAFPAMASNGDYSNFTISAWIKPDSLGLDNIHHNFYLHATSGGNGSLNGNGNFDNKLMVRNDSIVMNLFCSGTKYELSHPIQNYNNWMHITYTASRQVTACGSSPWQCALRLFIDGHIVDSTSLNNDIDWTDSWLYERIGGSGTYHGKIDLDDSVKDKFETEDANTTLFKINSGTVEMRDNKLILLAD